MIGFNSISMTMTNAIQSNREIAFINADLGYTSIPCHPCTKTPCVKWKQWQTEMPSSEIIEQWFADARRNIAIITTGMIVFDCDEFSRAILVIEHCGDTPHKLLTPRGGIHLGYRKRKGVRMANQVKIKGLPIDIRTDGGLEMIPPSVTEHGRYQWLGEGLRPLSELPVGKVGWTRERTRRSVKTLVIDEADLAARRARAYLATIEGAVAGQRGHDRTFRAACVLVQKFGLSFEQAFPLLKEWSDCSCEPPWSDAELEHKLLDALRRRSG